MDDKTKEIGLMVGSGIVTGILFNVAITGNPMDLGGILGGALTGILMFALA